MAVTITNNMTLIDDADVITGWTSSGGGFTAYTGFERELTGNLGEQASEGYIDGYFTQTSTNFSDVTVFGPWMRSGNPDAEANTGFGIILGDGTNRISYGVGGSDNYGHFVLGWSMFKLDTTVLPATNFRVLAGAEASLTLTTTTQTGGSISYVSKASGNSDNVFWDILRYIANGTAALRVSGGGVGTEGTFAEIVTEDISTADGKAYGILRELVPGSKSYEMNYGVDFGDAGTSSVYFADSDFQLYIAGSNMKAGNMDVTLLANATGTNLFTLDNFVVVNIGTVSNWDLSSTNMDTMEITNGQFVDLGTFKLPANTATKKLTNTSFVNCGQVDADDLTFTDNTFVGTSDATGALLISSTTNQSDLTFTSDGTGHAIYITTAGTYTFTNFTYSGYGATATTDAVIYNNSGGLVTINVVGGDSPTYLNGTSATTTVNAAVNLTMTVKDSSGTEVVGAYAYIDDNNITPFIMNTTTDVNGEATVSHNGGAVVGSTWRIRKYGYHPFVGVVDIGATDINLPITLIEHPQQT